MSNAGSALMGIGSARGDDRAVAAAEIAVASPLLEASIDGAHGVLLSIAGGSDLGLFEIQEAAALVADAVHAEANIIFGTIIDDALGDEVRVTVIAAGFDGGQPKKRETTLRGQAMPGMQAPAQSAPQAPARQDRQERQERPAPVAAGAPAQSTPAPAQATTPAGPATPPPSAPRQAAPSVDFADDDLDVPDFLK
jgi:cell division protein FtsZ